MRRRWRLRRRVGEVPDFSARVRDKLQDDRWRERSEDLGDCDGPDRRRATTPTTRHHPRWTRPRSAQRPSRRPPGGARGTVYHATMPRAARRFTSLPVRSISFASPTHCGRTSGLAAKPSGSGSRSTSSSRRCLEPCAPWTSRTIHPLTYEDEHQSADVEHLNVVVHVVTAIRD